MHDYYKIINKNERGMQQCRGSLRMGAEGSRFVAFQLESDQAEHGSTGTGKQLRLLWSRLSVEASGSG